MRRSLPILLLLLPIGVFAQTAHIFVSANNVAYGQNTDGRLFNGDDGYGPGFEAPAGSGIYAVYNAGLWFAGIAPNQSIVSSSQGYCNESCVFGPGPLKADGSLQSTPEAQQAANRFWVITSGQLMFHQLYFDCVVNPSCNPATTFPGGYTIPSDFLTWPAQGNTEEGFAQYLAPFFDFNNDGIYNADQGDYPLVCGDLAVYSIMNDNPEQGENRAGIEVHTTLYTFNSSDAALFNTVFVNQRIINRSNNIYSDSYLGVWNDFDLGNYSDDYVGTDVARSMVYVYNGNNFDAPISGSSGAYLDDLGVVGMRMLRGAFADANGNDDAPEAQGFSSYGNQTSGWGDGVADNERLGLAYSMSRNNTSMGAPLPTTDPVTAVLEYAALKGLWNDGTPQSYGGIGYNPTLPALTYCKYAYPGDSDPLLLGTFGVDPNYPISGGWTEANANNPPGDRRMIASTGPFTFAPGDVQHLDYAYIFARDSHEPGVDVLETLRSYADAIVGMECGQLPQIITGTRQSMLMKDHFSVYPNPAQQIVTLDIGTNIKGKYTLFDLTGRIIVQGELNNSITAVNIEALNHGIYLIQLEADEKFELKKLIVQ